MSEKVILISDLEKINEVIDILLAAINDWPNSILSLENFESEIRDFIGNETIEQKIEMALTEIDFSKHSWEAESLSQVVGIFKFYNKGVSLKEIIRDLSRVIRK